MARDTLRHGAAITCAYIEPPRWRPCSTIVPGVPCHPAGFHPPRLPRFRGRRVRSREPWRFISSAPIISGSATAPHRVGLPAACRAPIAAGRPGESDKFRLPRTCAMSAPIAGNGTSMVIWHARHVRAARPRRREARQIKGSGGSAHDPSRRPQAARKRRRCTLPKVNEPRLRSC